MIHPVTHVIILVIRLSAQTVLYLRIMYWLMEVVFVFKIISNLIALAQVAIKSIQVVINACTINQMSQCPLIKPLLRALNATKH